jgi:ribosome maturation protein SDO1
MIKKGLDVLSKQGGHVPPQDSLGHKLGKLNLGDGGKKGSAASKGSNDTSGQATPMTDDDTESTGNAKAKKSDMPIWTGVVTTKSVKQQALEAIRALIAWQPIPVMRARMRLRITCPTSIAKQTPKSKAASTEDGADGEQTKSTGTIKERILSYVEQIESQEVQGEEWEAIGFVEPGAFKALGELCSAETKGKARLEVLDMAVTHTDD